MDSDPVYFHPFLVPKVRERAIKEITKVLDQVEAFELIGLAIKFDVEQWLKPAYRRIVTRSNLITHAEAAKVSFAMAVILMRSREQYWKLVHNPIPALNYRAQPSISLDQIIDSEIKIMVSEPTETPKRGAQAFCFRGGQ
jgi:hypothetical protein